MDQDDRARQITLTEQAAARLRPLLSGTDGDHGIRVGVEPGGCAGMRYAMSIDDEYAPGDTVVESHGIPVFIPTDAVPLVAGAIVDFDEFGFSIANPNSRAMCSCGASFSLGRAT